MEFFVTAVLVVLHTLFFGAGLAWWIMPRPWQRWWPVLATLLGLTLAAAGVVGIGWVAWLWWRDTGPVFGWGSLMAALLLFSGTQLVMLGLIGEYIGRMFLAVNGRPQSVVRAVERSA